MRFEQNVGAKKNSLVSVDVDKKRRWTIHKSIKTNFCLDGFEMHALTNILMPHTDQSFVQKTLSLLIVEHIHTNVHRTRSCSTQPMRWSFDSTKCLALASLWSLEIQWQWRRICWTEINRSNNSIEIKKSTNKQTNSVRQVALLTVYLCYIFIQWRKGK